MAAKDSPEPDGTPASASFQQWQDSRLEALVRTLSRR